MKKKILFVIPSFKIGGIENALINMLEYFDYDKFDVYAFVFHYDEEQIKRVDPRVKILRGSALLNLTAMTMTDAKNAGLFPAIVRAIMAVLCKYIGAKPVFSFIFQFEKKIKDMDIAISYSNNVNTNSTYYGSNLFVLKKVEANKKMAWLHVDYEAMNMNTAINNNEYRAFDEVIAVSKAVKELFLKYNPSMKDKTHVIYNVLPKSGYGKLIEKTSSDEKVILTVGRLDPNKNQLQCLAIADRLRSDDLKFKWLLVGDGEQKNEVQDSITRMNLQDYVEITGYTLDVNQYLQQADLFVSTSLSESYGMSIVEAQAVGLPVVVKDYPAAKEIVDGTNGILVQDYDEMYSQIKRLLTDDEAYTKLKNNTRVLQNDEENMQVLYEMIGNI